MPRETRTGISFAETVAAGGTTTQSYTVDRPGTVENLQIRIYSGAETDLEIEPFVITPDKQKIPLVETRGKAVIDGDDDVYSWSLSLPVEQEAIIKVEANNTDSNNAYDYRANVEVDFRGANKSIFEVF